MYILIEFSGGKGWWRKVDFSTGEGCSDKQETGVRRRTRALERLGVRQSHDRKD
jgi:hypothetical protein